MSGRPVSTLCAVAATLAALLVPGVLACSAGGNPQVKGRSARSAPRVPLPEACKPLPTRKLTYTDVEPSFIQHCHRCHTVSYGTNEKAQVIYESTRYPFTTAVADTLLAGMADQWWTRRGIDESERCLVLHWLHQGALDADGNPPPYAPL
jgi:hypothetical protein